MKIVKKRLIIWIVIIVLILAVPLVLMQFKDEIDWNLLDFVIIGIILIGTGVFYELIARKSTKIIYRVALGIGLVGIFLLFWVNGAVGIIGNEGQPPNLMYGAVFVVAIIGSLVARFKSHGMSRVFFSVALVQMLVPVIALIIWPPPNTSWAPSITGVFLLSAFFAVLFNVSAMLFRRANSSKNIDL